MLLAAVGENASWCALVAEAHGLVGVNDLDAWSCARRTPPLYPDAVTLRRSVPADSLLDRIDAGEGASVKDSFADLELGRFGFRVLVDGAWFAWPIPSSVLRSASTGLTWSIAAPGDLAGLLPGAVSERVGAHVDVTVMGARSDAGAVVGALVVHRSHGVLGVSNVVVPDGSDRWAAIAEAIGAAGLSPASVVGWEPREVLAAGVPDGAGVLGPMRVWVR